MARAKTDRTNITATDRAPRSPAQPAAASISEVAQRAYGLYLARGCEHGHNVDDWLEAERDVRSATTLLHPPSR